MAKNINYSIKVGVIGDAQLQKFQRSIEKINKTSAQTAKGVKRMGDSMSKLSRLAGIASTAMAAFYSAKGLTNLIGQADAMRNLEASFSTLLGTGERASAMMEEVFAIAKRTGAPINDVAEAAQRLAVGMGEMGASNAQITTVAETFIKLGRVGGASMADVNGALVQFSQGLSSGRLQGDEFRSISERLPLVMRALSKELGVTVGELKKMGTEGKITADVMANAMINAAKDVDGQFAKLPLTFEQASNNFKTMLTQFSRSTAVVSAIDALARGLGSITTNVNSFVNDMSAMIAGMSSFEKKAVTTVAAIGAITIAIRALMMSNPFTAIATGAVTAVGLIILNWNKVKDYFNYTLPIFLLKAQVAWKDFTFYLLDTIQSLLTPMLKAMDNLINGVIQPINNLLTYFGKAAIEVDAAGAAFNGLGETMKANRIASMGLLNEMWALQDAQKAAGEASAELVTELDAGVKAFDKMNTAADDLKKKLKDAADSINNSFSKAMEDGIINAAKGGKDAFKNMAQSILEDIARMMIRIKILQPLMKALNPGASLFGSARGDVFLNGVGNGRPYTAYAAGGIVSGRTAIGSSLIGEGGGGRSEAVVPLRRHGGKMGVAASPVNINVINNSSSNVEVSESTGNDGSKTIEVLIDGKVREAFSSGRMDKTMRANFGIKRVGG